MKVMERYYILGTETMENGSMMARRKCVLSDAVGTSTVAVITHFDTDAARYCLRE